MTTNMTDLEKAQGMGKMAAAHFHMLEKSIIEIRDSVKVRKCDTCGDHSNIDIEDVTYVLDSFYHIFKEYEEEMLYCKFDYEKLFDEIAKITNYIVDTFREDFDAERWMEMHGNEDKDKGELK